MGVKEKIWTLSILTIILGIVQCYSVEKYSLLMPNVRPNVSELYLCTPVRVDSTRNYYIIGFEPNATMAVAHHMLLYGCSKPGSADPVWNCGEMAEQSIKSGFNSSSPCSEDSQIIYAWAKDAPKLILPEDVGFKVGGNSAIQYLVLQVHYAHIDMFQDGSTDDSGIFLHYTKHPMNNLAGIFLLGTGGRIPPNRIEHMETACSINENKTIHPFAYRVHTHSLGRVVSGYVIKPQNNEWIELGKQDPMKPQMFYPVHNKSPIYPKDTLAARCTMRNTRNRWTLIGSTNNDEMCNFYLMYYVKNGEPLKQKYCFSAGPPYYYWEYAKLTNIPDKKASRL